jgi:hypothetical protein
MSHDPLTLGRGGMTHHFNALISKIIFFKKKYFDAFPSKKHFEK